MRGVSGCVWIVSFIVAGGKHLGWPLTCGLDNSLIDLNWLLIMRIHVKLLAQYQGLAVILNTYLNHTSNTVCDHIFIDIFIIIIPIYSYFGNIFLFDFVKKILSKKIFSCYTIRFIPCTLNKTQKLWKYLMFFFSWHSFRLWDLPFLLFFSFFFLQNYECTSNLKKFDFKNKKIKKYKMIFSFKNLCLHVFILIVLKKKKKKKVCIYDIFVNSIHQYE